MSKKADKNGRHIREGYRERLRELLIPKGFTEETINLILEEVVWSFRKFGVVDLTKKKRTIKYWEKTKKGRELFALTELVYSSDRLNYAQINTSKRKNIFKEDLILELIRIGLDSLIKTNTLKDTFFSETLDQKMPIQSLSFVIRRMANQKKLGTLGSSMYHQKVLIFDILYCLGLIVDDGSKSNDDKSAFLEKHVLNDEQFHEIVSLKLSKQEEDEAILKFKKRQIEIDKLLK